MLSADRSFHAHNCFDTYHVGSRPKPHIPAPDLASWHGCSTSARYSDKLEQPFSRITVQHQDRSAGRAGAPPRRPTEFHFDPARFEQFSCRPIFLVLRHGRRSWPLASPFPSGECQSADGHTRQDMDTCFQPRRSADDRRPIEKMKTIFALKSFCGIPRDRNVDGLSTHSGRASAAVLF